MSSIPDQLNFGLYLPTTNVWDPTPISSIQGASPELKELLVRLYQNIGNIAQAVNKKDTGLYVEQEIVNNQLFFQDPNLTRAPSTSDDLRPVFRKVINFGALPNGTKTVAHSISNIDSNWSIVRLYGAATNPTTLSYLPLPYAHPTAANMISLSMDNTNISITTGSNRTAYTKTYVVVEYLKN